MRWKMQMPAPTPANALRSGPSRAMNMLRRSKAMPLSLLALLAITLPAIESDLP